MPVLMTKIPEDVRLLVGREIKDGEWNISEILKLLRNKWSMFCKQQHPTASCHVVTNKMARKKCLKKQGRCLICLKKSHLARDCRSKISCFKCSGRHHVSLCEIEPPTTETRQTNVNSGNATNRQYPPAQASTFYVGSQDSILMQTAQVLIRDKDADASQNFFLGITFLGSLETRLE